MMTLGRGYCSGSRTISCGGLCKSAAVCQTSRRRSPTCCRPHLGSSLTGTVSSSTAACGASCACLRELQLTSTVRRRDCDAPWRPWSSHGSSRARCLGGGGGLVRRHRVHQSAAPQCIGRAKPRLQCGQALLLYCSRVALNSMMVQAWDWKRAVGAVVGWRCSR